MKNEFPEVPMSVTQRLVRHPFLWNWGAEILVDSLPPLNEKAHVVVLDPWKISEEPLSAKTSLMSSLRAQIQPQHKLTAWHDMTAAPEFSENDLLMAPFPALSLSEENKSTPWQRLRQILPQGSIKLPQVLLTHGVVLAVAGQHEGQKTWIKSPSMDPPTWISTLMQAGWQTMGLRVEELECHYRRPASLWRDINLYEPSHSLWTPTHDRFAMRRFWTQAIKNHHHLALRFGLLMAWVKSMDTSPHMTKELAIQWQVH